MKTKETFQNSFIKGGRYDKKILALFLSFFLAVLISGCAHFQPGHTLSDARIKKILEKRIDVYEQNIGMVVGVIDSGGRRIIAYGLVDKDSGKPVDGNTIYEIGSRSKVFTALILADMSIIGEINLNDPIDKYLPAGISMPC